MSRGWSRSTPAARAIRRPEAGARPIVTEAAVTAPVRSPASAAARPGSAGLGARSWAVLEEVGGRTAAQSVGVVTEVRGALSVTH